MTDCPNGTLRDQLPDYVHGALSAPDMARVDAHLAECAACRDEVGVLRAVRDLMHARAPRMDVAGIVAALPHAPVRKRGFVLVPRVWQYAAAASLALAVGTATLRRTAMEPAAANDADSVVATRSATTTTSTASMPDAQAPGSVSFGGGLSDLSVEELQHLLVQMDSVRTVPSADPEALTPVITVKEGGRSL